MRDLSFDVELTWSGTGRQGAGPIQTDDLALELSGPESMGGRCFIGHTLAPDVVDEVGSVHVRGDLALAPTADQAARGLRGCRRASVRFVPGRHRRHGMTTSTSNVAKAGPDRDRECQGHATQVEELARFVCRSRWEEISEPAREQLKLRVLDSLGVRAGCARRRAGRDGPRAGARSSAARRCAR